MRYLKLYDLEGTVLVAVDVTPEPHDSFNYAYVIRGDRGGDCALFDPGPSSSCEWLVRVTRRLGCERLAVFLSHVHVDHAGCAGGLVELYGGRTRVYVHPRGSRHVTSVDILWETSVRTLGELAMLYGRPRPIDSDAIEETSDGEVVETAGLAVTVVHTPGHASHHQSFLLEDLRLLMAGEAFGLYLEEQDASLPASPPPFRPDLYVESMRRLASLGPILAALPHNSLVEVSGHVSRHIEQLDIWRREAIGLGPEDLDEYLSRLRVSDESVRRLSRAVGNPLIEVTLRTSASGALQAFAGGGKG